MSFDDEDTLALKIHGYRFSDASDSSDGSKSTLDEDYYRLQPPPIQISKTKRKIVNINNKNEASTSNANSINTIPDFKSAGIDDVTSKNKFPQKQTDSYSNSVHISRNKRYSAGQQTVANKRNFGKTKLPQRNLNWQQIPHCTSNQQKSLVNTSSGGNEAWNGTSLLFTNNSNQLRIPNLPLSVENVWRNQGCVNQNSQNFAPVVASHEQTCNNPFEPPNPFILKGQNNYPSLVEVPVENFVKNVNQKQPLGTSNYRQNNTNLMKDVPHKNTTNNVLNVKCATAKNVNRKNKFPQRNSCSNINSGHILKNKRYLAGQQIVANTNLSKVKVPQRNTDWNQTTSSNCISHQERSLPNPPIPVQSFGKSQTCDKQSTQNYGACKPHMQALNNSFEASNSFISRRQKNNAVNAQLIVEKSIGNITNQKQLASSSNYSQDNQKLMKGETQNTPKNISGPKMSNSSEMQVSSTEQYINEILNQPLHKSTVENATSSVTNQRQSLSGCNHNDNNPELVKDKIQKNRIDLVQVETSSCVFEVPDLFMSAEQHGGIIISQPVSRSREDLTVASNQERANISDSQNTSKTFCDRLLRCLFCISDNNFSN